jgi:hypothetical protein
VPISDQQVVHLYLFGKREGPAMVDENSKAKWGNGKGGVAVRVFFLAWYFSPS